MTEKWIPFRSGEYEVSDLGNFRRATPGISTFVGRPLQPLESATGYLQVALRIDGRSLRLYAHRVVAEAFLGPCPVGHVVNHKDCNKRNNALAIWSTPQPNKTRCTPSVMWFVGAVLRSRVRLSRDALGALIIGPHEIPSALPAANGKELPGFKRLRFQNSFPGCALVSRPSHLLPMSLGSAGRRSRAYRAG